MDVKYRGNTYSVDPSKATYRLTYIPTKNVRGGKKYNGPYWYAKIDIGGEPRTIYLGKDLPDECKPFIKEPEPDIVQTHIPRYDGIRRALFQGNQVMIDIAMIAKACGAEYQEITPSKFLLYIERDENG